MAFYRALADKQDQVYGALCVHDTRNRLLQTAGRSEHQAIKAEKVIRCLLQIHIAQEETKFGFSFDECKEMLNAAEWKALANIQICGLMGMATNTDSKEQIEREFRSLNCFFHEVKKQYFANEPTFCELSMGMSHDYHLAIKEGSTLVRVGSKIFGERVY